MDDGSPLSPSIFARIETLRQWQSEQQRKLIEQQSQQAQFLSKEHQRMYKALGIQQNEKSAATVVEIYEVLKRNKQQLTDNHQSNKPIIDSDEEDIIDKSQISNNHFDQTNIEICEEEIPNKMRTDSHVQSAVEYYESKKNRGNRSIDEIPIKSPTKDFTALLEEKLRENDEQVIQRDVRPKKQFLKKGVGLRRFRMTMQDLAYKKPKPKLCLDKKKCLSPKKKKSPEKKKISPKRNSNNIKNRHSSDSKQKPKFTHQTASHFKENTSNFSSTHDEQLYSFPNSPNMSPIRDNKIEPLVLNSEDLVLNTKTSNFNSNIMNSKNLTTPKKYAEPVLTWTPVQGNKSTNYQALLAELIEVRQRNPALFDTPSMNQTNLTNQQVFERDLLDELKMFEALEQKAANSSFCSNSSLVTKFMEYPIKSTPRKQLNFTLLTNGIAEENNHAETKKLPQSPKKNVKFSEKTEQLDSTIQETEEETSSSSDESDNESSSESASSINSDDVSDVKTIVPTKYQKRRSSTPENTTPVKMYIDAATNTEQPMITSDLLKTRLAELETELSTFRSENTRINKLKSQLETENRNFERRKKQLEKDIEMQKTQMKAQLDEERAKLSKDRAVYNRYAQEIKEGKSARQKEREELNTLRSRVTSIQEEMKLKESKWGATQARIRSQLKHLEKENAALRTENNELRSKNGKLEATNKQLFSRRPSDTKVLHEINKNLTKLAQETKEKIGNKDKTKTPAKKIENKRRSKSRSRQTPSPTEDEEKDKENHRHCSLRYIENSEETYRRRSLNSTDESKSSTEHSFESIEREYEKLFGRMKSYECEENVPIADASVSSDMSTRREETALEDGSKRISYANGNVKTISPDGQMVVMQYHNGDVKETCKETGTIRYLYADAKTWHTTYPDGIEILEFANGQIEKRFANGSSEILFPNGCRRCSSPGGSEEVTFPDGTLLLTRPSSGEKILTLPNGQREIHTKDHKRREYPDGTVKILYPDGVQETRYANGRIRLKDKQGNLIMDSASV